MAAYAQDAQQAAAEAAKAMEAAPAVEVKIEKPKYWASSLKTNLTEQSGVDTVRDFNLYPMGPHIRP